MARSVGTLPTPPRPVNAQETRFLRRPRHLVSIGSALAAALALLAFGAGIATTEPAAIEAKRAELARVQSELNAIEGQVEQAAEAYNGARYELGQVTERIDANERQSVQTQKDLEASREILAQRLRALYASPDPSLSEQLAGLVESLMGRKPELRLAFIQENAKFARDLDV